MINTMVWNIRGVVGHDTSHSLKKLLKIHSASLLVVLEVIDALQREVFKNKFNFHLGLCNLSNKLWVFCKVGFAVDVLINSNQILHLAITHECWNSIFYCTFVYTKCMWVEWHSLWVDL